VYPDCTSKAQYPEPLVGDHSTDSTGAELPVICQLIDSPQSLNALQFLACRKVFASVTAFSALSTHCLT
jgi:hypothetical protein